MAEQAAAASEGPSAEESALSLDGVWRVQPEGGQERDLAVPGFWDRAEGMRDVHRATYRRAFDVPQDFAGRRVLLRFDAAGDAAEVWVNGWHAGQHVGPALPFEVDVTDLVEVPSTGNRLEVVVRDDTHFGVPREGEGFRAYKHWIPRGMGRDNRKGLYQSVTLRARPPVHVASVHVRTPVRKRELTVTWEIFNSRRETVKARLGGEVRPASGGGAVLTLPEAPVELPGYVTTSVTITAPFRDVTLWQPDHPALYTLHTTLAAAEGQPLHRLQTRFGFREVWFEGIHFYLNGIRCNLRGESPAYAEKADLLSTREAAEETVRRYQKANCNYLRFHAMPAPPHVLDVCDELGMLVVDESAIYASWQMLMPEHPGWMEACREHLTRWVRRDRNHPSVVLWSAENEGLNVGVLSPAMLAEFRKVIDAADGSRPVIFDGDGTGYGASPASVKHYVRTLEDLRDCGGRSSGYSRDLRSDIYWATEYRQDVPLGCGEYLFPYEPGLRDKEREVAYMMGLQARGYRLADWFLIGPYNASYTGFLRKEGVRPGYEEAYDVIVKSFAPVAVFDKEYDALGPYPEPPRLPAGREARRTLIVYNDTFADDRVEVVWAARQGDRAVAEGRRTLTIPLGGRALLEVAFTPTEPGELSLELTSRKGGQETFRDTRRFVVE